MATFQGHNENISGVCFAPKKHNFFASVSQDNTLKVWNVLDENEEVDRTVNSANMTIMAHQKYINAVRVAPNDKLIATSSQDKTINIWQASSLTLKKTLQGHRSGIWDIQFAPTEQLLVSASGDKMCKVWNVSTGECLATLQGHTQALVKVAWLNAGLQIATASVDGIVKIWNYRKQQCQNTFEMHEEKIWAMDFLELSQEEGAQNAERETLRMITGAGDSTVKLWTDSTLEEQVKEQEGKIALREEEQKLSQLMRDNDLVAASVLAFKLNKLRDFFHAMDRLVSGRAPPPKPFFAGMPGQVAPVLSRIQDPIESILLNQENFETVLATGQPHQSSTDRKKQTKAIAKVIGLLIKEDKKKLFEMIKKLNARQQYASMAQTLLKEMLPRFSADELVDEFKQSGGGLGAILEATEMYSGKHYTRVDSNLKRTFYVQYVLSQMTLLDNTKSEFNNSKDNDNLDEKSKTLQSKADRKRDRKAQGKKEARISKDQKKSTKKQRKSSHDNLFV